MAKSLKDSGRKGSRQTKSSMVNEEGLQYEIKVAPASNKSKQQVIDSSVKLKPSSYSIVLSASSFKPESLMTPMEKMVLIEDGISKKDLEDLKQKTNLDYDQLAQVLSVARATLINKKGKEHFSSELSNKIVALADLYSYGYEVFEDNSTFNAWIFRPNKALGGKLPFDLLHNSYGREEVRNIIGRIDYGVYS